jgi:hypothetical protein
VGAERHDQGILHPARPIRFRRFRSNLYHGQVADDIPAAEALGSALDGNFLQAKAEIADAVTYLDARTAQVSRGMAVIGFSLGVYYALDLAAADPKHIRSVVIYYGTGDGDYSSSKAAYLGHFAEEDQFEPQSSVNDLEASLRRAGRFGEGIDFQIFPLHFRGRVRFAINQESAQRDPVDPARRFGGEVALGNVTLVIGRKKQILATFAPVWSRSTHVDHEAEIGINDRPRAGPRWDLNYCRAILLQVKKERAVDRIRVTGEPQGIAVHQIIENNGLVAFLGPKFCRT